MKTASLISAGVQGVFVLKKEETATVNSLKQIGCLIGQAFQLSDDLQDFADKKSNFAVSLGYKTAQKKLRALSEKALDLVARAGFSDSILSYLIIFNQNRFEE